MTHLSLFIISLFHSFVSFLVRTLIKACCLFMLLCRSLTDLFLLVQSFFLHSLQKISKDFAEMMLLTMRMKTVLDFKHPHTEELQIKIVQNRSI